MRRRICFFLLSLLQCAALRAVDAEVRQLIVSIAPGWDSSTGSLQCFERTASGWKPASRVVPVLYGRNGLAWGRGERGEGEPGLQKAERDGRAPAGVFALGTIYTYDTRLPGGADYPFHTVVEGDAWIDDVHHPQYNRFVHVDPRDPPPWFEKQKMRHNDFAYRWLVEIRHNSDPPFPGAGSAIFFHIRRGVTRPSSGCTTMAQADLVNMIRWLRAERHPHYVLLPRAEYSRKWRAWGLPPPSSLGALWAGR
jgi:L,D-peptidoglycan transpeptidase YkuD (ErfK/YbiS/YcfS/YnhG family)